MPTGEIVKIEAGYWSCNNVEEKTVWWLWWWALVLLGNFLENFQNVYQWNSAIFFKVHFFFLRFAAALLPLLFGNNPRSHHKGATSRVRNGDLLLPVLCHCQSSMGYAIYSWCYHFISESFFARYRETCILEADSSVMSLSIGATFGTIGLLSKCSCLNSVALMDCQVLSCLFIPGCELEYWFLTINSQQSQESKSFNAPEYKEDSIWDDAKGISNELLNHFLLRLTLASTHTGAMNEPAGVAAASSMSLNELDC